MNKKILIVDDDNILRDMYHERLKADGFEIETATNGKEALEKLDSFRPDLILLDVMMPYMNGFATLEHIRADDNLKNIPVFMLTALVQEENRKKAVKLGANGFVIKSETMPGDLVEKIKKELDKS